MPEIEFQGSTFVVDEDGFIDSYTNWSEGWGDIDQAKKEILEGVDNYNKAKVKPAF